MSQQDFLTLEEAAKALKKSVQTLRRMIKRGEMPAQRVRTPQGFNYVIRKDDVIVEETPVPEPAKEVLSNSPIQTEVLAQQQEAVQVLTSQKQIPTSQSELMPLLENVFYTIDRNLSADGSRSAPLLKVIELQHKEKMMLIRILEKMQMELNQRSEKPRSFLDRMADWFFE